MLYIVKTDNFAFDPTMPPQQAAGLIENMVIPTAERLIQLKSEGKVLVAGEPTCTSTGLGIPVPCP